MTASLSFDRAASYYDATRGYAEEVGSAIAAAIAAVVCATPATRFLDLGVGTGRVALPLALLGHSVTGIDISRAMLACLVQKLDEYARAGRTLPIQVLEADAQALPFGDGEFDAIVATHVFHLVADPRQAAQEALRVLRPGGSLLVCGDEVAGWHFTSVNEKWRELLRRYCRPRLSSMEAADKLIRDLCRADPALVVEEARPVSWRSTTTVADELDSIRRRLWSNTWLVPDDVFEACFGELATWCATTFADGQHEPLLRTSEFVIRRVHRR
jgi:ubiquinone/menaquinone biosynthesis C-methylase UbiE